MARIRTIKPDFFTSEDVSELPLRARLTWIGLWTHCDDHGRTKDVVRLIKAAVWPLDDLSLADVEEDLVTLASAGRIVRYEVDGRAFLAVVNWHVHQAIQKPSQARHPAPPAPVNPTDPTATGYCRPCSEQAPVGLPETDGNPTVGLSLGKEGKGREGTRETSTAGTVQEVPRGDPTKCLSHQRNPNPGPCGACASARTNHQSKPTPTPSQPVCPIHPGNPAGNVACPECTRVKAPVPDLRDRIRSTRTEEAS